MTPPVQLPDECPACEAALVEHCDSPACPWRRCRACKAVAAIVLGALKVLT